MKTNQFDQMIITEQEAIDALYSGQIKNLDQFNIEGDIAQYNQARQTNADQIPLLKELEDLSNTNISDFDKQNRKSWFIPEQYKTFDIESWLYSKCQTTIQNERVKQELDLYKKYNVFDVLNYLKYLIDVIKDNNINIGVGRGSSVASYVLYLMDIHKIDSIKYELDITEFLKEN